MQNESLLREVSQNTDHKENNTIISEEIAIIENSSSLLQHTRLSSFKSVAKSALPLFISYGMLSLEDFLSGVMVSKLGNDAISALSLATVSQSLMFIVSTAPLYTISGLTAQQDGLKNKLNAGAILQHGMLLGTILTVPPLVIFLNIEKILEKLGQEKILAELVADYFNAYAIGLPAATWQICGTQFISGLDNQKALFGISAFNFAFGSLMRYILILATRNQLNLGLAGLGYANSIRAWVSSLLLGGIFYFHKTYGPYKIFNFRLRETSDILKRMISIGWPISFHMLSRYISALSNTLMANKLNPEGLAIQQVIWEYQNMAAPLQISLAQVGDVFVGKSVGMANLKNMQLLGNTTFAAGAGVSLLVAMAYVTMPKQLASLFIEVADAETEKLVRFLFLTYALIQFFDCTRDIAKGTLRGLNDTKIPMLAAFFGALIVGLPLGYALSFGIDWNLVGLAIGTCVGMGSETALLLFRWNKKSKQLPLVIAEDDASNSCNSFPFWNKVKTQKYKSITKIHQQHEENNEILPLEDPPSP